MGKVNRQRRGRLFDGVKGGDWERKTRVQGGDGFSSAEWLGYLISYTRCHVHLFLLEPVIGDCVLLRTDFSVVVCIGQFLLPLTWTVRAFPSTSLLRFSEVSFSLIFTQVRDSGDLS